MANTSNPFATGNTYVDPNAETEAQFKQKQLDAATWGGSTDYLGTIDPVDIAAIKNSQDINSVLNASAPTPLGGGQTPSTISALLNLGAVEPSQAMNSAASIQKGSPVSPAESINPTVGYQPILPKAAPDASIVPATAAPISATPSPAAPGFVNPLGGAFAAQNKANVLAAEAGRDTLVAENAYYIKKGEEDKKADEKARDLENKFNFEFQGRMDDLTSSMKDYKALAGQKIIPGALLARQDTSATIATGISVALGAMAGALNGTNQNIGLEMINKAIDKDVESQKFNLDTAIRIGRTNIDDQSNMLSKMREKFKDDTSAILATKTAMTTMALDKMNETLTKEGGAKDKGIQAQASMARAQLLEKKTMYEQQLKVAQSDAFQRAQIIDSVGKKKDWSDVEIAAYEAATGEKGVRDRLVPGWGPAKNKNLAEDFTKYNGEVTPAIDSIDRIKALTNGFNKVIDLSTKRKIEVERQALVGALRLPFTGPGILNDGERAMLEKLIGDPTKMLSLSSLEAASLAQVQIKLKNDQNKRAKNAGLATDDIASLTRPKP